MIMFVSISLLAILIIILIGYIIKLTIRKPLVLLQNDMEKVAAGDLTTRTPYKANNELGAYCSVF